MIDRIIRVTAVAAFLAGPASLCAEESGEQTPVADPGSILPAAERLEADNARIGSITIINNNIFDLDDPSENRLLFRLANKLHIKTKKDLIAAQLLFAEGDAYSKRQLDESERLLRANRYLREAAVSPVAYKDGVVDLEVNTYDVWTLNLGIGLWRTGGKSDTSIGLQEYNLFGTGAHIGIGYESDVDRKTRLFQYTDRNFRRSRDQLKLLFEDSDDGFERNVSFSRPFYSLDTRRSWGVSSLSGERIDSLYDRGEIEQEFEDRYEYHQAFVGWSDGLRDDRVTRFAAGLVYDSHRFAATDDPLLSAPVLPEDREYLYPFFSVELIREQFEKTSNFDQIDRTEDRFLGTRFQVSVGYSAESAGSTANAVHLNGAFNYGLVTLPSKTLLLSGRFGGRLENGEVHNARIDGELLYHQRDNEKRLFFIRLSGSLGKNLDLDRPLYLGGDSGLRGYPLRYQGGDKNFLLTVERRYFSNWNPFHLFYVGSAVFFDAGRT
ncbi:MAG: hypothetical protein GWP02_07900, partial [Desulfobulbaceae bacterium]|nr:hypothetical protein [Desulfobulbaceae bacterium]